MHFAGCRGNRSAVYVAKRIGHNAYAKPVTYSRTIYPHALITIIFGKHPSVITIKDYDNARLVFEGPVFSKTVKFITIFIVYRSRSV